MVIAELHILPRTLFLSLLVGVFFLLHTHSSCGLKVAEQYKEHSFLKCTLGLQVASAQETVHQKLHMLEAHQKETHDSLLQMERTAISMYQVCLPSRLSHQHVLLCGKNDCSAALPVLYANA